MKTIQYQEHTLQVSEDGQLITCDGIELKQCITGKTKHNEGYYFVYIDKKLVYTHLLVALAYKHNPKPGTYTHIGFINPAKTLFPTKDNIYWRSGSTMRLVDPKAATVRHRSTLSYEKCIQIYKLNSQGVSQLSLAQMFNTSRSTVQRAISCALRLLSVQRIQTNAIIS